jgi:hypothetical protein
MSLPLKKIYVDTRYRTPDSISTSNFKIELPYSLTLPDNSSFQLTDICIEHSWLTVETGINDQLYFAIATGNAPGMVSGYVMRLPSQNYTGTTLASTIQTMLQTQSYDFQATYDANRNVITITSSTLSFQLLTDVDVLYQDIGTWIGGITLDRTNLRSANDLLRNYAGRSLTYGLQTGSNAIYSYTSGFLDLQPIRNIFISSPNLGSFNTLGSKGEANIICKVPVNADFGYLILANIIAPHDFLNCSKQTLRTVEFHIKDVKGNYIPLHGGHCSFSIVFSAIFEDV